MKLPHRPSRIEILESRIAPALANPLPLGDVNGANGFHLSGLGASGYGERPVAVAGDVNGDGFEDVVFGATGINAAFVVFGKADGFSEDLDLTTLDGTAGFRIDGTAASRQFGQSVSGAGDVNGDGFADLVVGAFNETIGANDQAGAAYVIFGQASFGATLSITALNGANGFKISGVAKGDQAGSEVGAGGDLNGDGYDDVVVSALGADPHGSNSGAAYVILGKASGFVPNLSLSALDGRTGFKISGAAASDFLGSDPSSAGDLNGDGLGDLILGAQGANANGADSGAAYVVFGRTSFTANFDVSTLNGTNGFRLRGGAAGDSAGFATNGGGDVNGDGFADLVVGAFFSKAGGLQSGAAYVVFGKGTPFAANLSLSALDGSNGFVLLSEEAGALTGYSVESGGDVNGDGFDDVIVSAPGTFNRAGDATVYVIYGGPGFAATVALADLDGSNGVKLLRGAASDSSGSEVSGGDVNGDGLHDLIISDYFGGYVVFGSASPSVSALGNTGANALTGSVFPDAIVGGAANDTLLGLGAADVLRGGQGDDLIAIADLDFFRIRGGLGTDTLRLDGAGLALNLITLSDTKLEGVERIDLTGSGANSLMLNAREVLNLSANSNTLTVLGGADDFVNFDAGWIREANQVEGATILEVFTKGAATLRIATGVGHSLATGYVLGTVGNALSGLTLNGVAANDQARFTGSAGDVNGDGFDDFLIGAPLASPNGANSGAAYVIFGKAGGFTSPLELSTLNGTNGFAIRGGATGDFLGFSGSAAGDFNGDGFGDIIVGARLADGTQTDAGAAYLIYGKGGAFAPAIEVAALDGTDGFKLRGISTNDDAGIAVHAAGDVNGDGFDDVAIGAPNGKTGAITQQGRVYVVFGRATSPGAAFDLAALNGTNGIRIVGTEKFELVGTSVSGGDVNGDGFFDVIVGSRAGKTFVVFGKAVLPVQTLTNALNGVNGFTINGVSLNGAAGQSVSAAGDVNGDGLGDLLIGAPNTVGPGGLTGAAFVVFGKAGATFGATVNLATLNGVNGFRISGKDAGDSGEYAGESVSAAGDVNGDGFDDVIVGAAFTDSRGVQSGEAYVIYGKATGPAVFDLATLDGTNGFSLIGDLDGARAGRSVGGVGDVNGDGFDDVLVGSYGPITGSNAPGRGYLVFGFDSGKVTHGGDANANTLTGAVGRDVIVAGQGGDTILNGGATDVLRGGQGNDNFSLTSGPLGRLVGGHGFDTLTLNGGLLLDLTARPVYRINGFEQVDLRPGVNYLSLDARAVVNASSDTNTLIVRADVGDIVNIGTGWTAIGSEVIDGDTFTVLTQGAAILKVSTVIAPVVTLVNATTATYRDVDGDLVTIKTSKGTLGISDFLLFSAGTVGGAQLAVTNFADDGVEFQGADLTITAQRTALGGDGQVNVGRIEASGVDLGKVSVAGDLRAIFAGDVNLATPGLTLLKMGSMGLLGVSTQGASGVGFSVIQGKLGALEIETDLVDAPISVFAGAGKLAFGSVSIGGSIIGGAAAFTGLFSDGTAGAIQIGQDLRGGSAEAAGTLKIDGDIASLSLGGSIVGGSGPRSAAVVTQGTLGATKIGGDLDRGLIAAKVGVKSLAIAGSVLNAQVLAGYDSLGLPVNADATIGAVTVSGDWVASNLVAGVRSSDPFFGNGGETLIVSGSPAVAGGDPKKIAKITSIVIAGEAIGTPGGTDHFGFVAEEIGSFSVGGTKFPLTNGAGNDLSGLRVGSTLDVKVREVKLLGVFEQAPAVEDPTGGPAFSLAAVNGKNGFRFDGLAQGDTLGRTVSSAGDVNGDGFDDIIIGSSGATIAGQKSRGEAYVIFGTDKGLPAQLDPKDLNGKNGFRIQAELGNSNSYFALAVGDAGDVNNDGFDDVIVGGIADGGGFTGTTEKVFVIFGKAGGFAPVLKASTLNGGNGFELSHPFAADPNFGTYIRMSVDGAGDLNGDGFDDLVIGAVNADFAVQNAGAAYVVFSPGATAPASINLNTLNGTNGFRLDGPNAFANLGYSVSQAGDVNGDGFDDLIVSAPRATVAGASSGSGYVVFGKNTPFAASFGVGALNGVNGFRIPAIDNRGDTGSTVSGGGDFNGDGVDDIVIGAPYAGPSFTYPGASYVIFGKETSTTGNFAADFALGTLNGANGFKITGESSYDYAGRAVLAGDVNGDGFADIAVGALGIEAHNEFRGGAYVIYGKATPPANFLLSSLDGLNGVKILGAKAGDQAGLGISGAGDFNNDGHADLLIGAYSAAFSGTYSGSAFLVSGASLTYGVNISADGKTATFTDVDGDLVTIKTSAGGFVPGDFTFIPAGPEGGIQLQALDLGGPTHTAFAGANLTVTATRGPVGGDGFVNIGALLAAGHDLGAVIVDGDLGQLDAGNGDGLKPAVAALTVQSLGRLGLSTQAAAGASLESNLKGKLGAFTAKSDIVGAFVKIDGSADAGDDDAGAITIGGSIRGGALAGSGSIFAAGDLGVVKIGQSIVGGSGAHSGSVEAGGRIASVTLGDSLRGGSGATSGSLIAGLALGATKIGGDLDGGRIFARGNLLPTSDTLALALGAMTVDGSVRGAKILAGVDRDGAAANPDAQIAAVAIGRYWIASDLIAGAVGGASIVSKIASIRVAGTALGTVGGADSFTFAAGQIGSFKIGATTVPLAPGPSNDITPWSLGPTFDLTLREF
jgi:hypothetical protein